MSFHLVRKEIRKMPEVIAENRDASAQRRRRQVDQRLLNTAKVLGGLTVCSRAFRMDMA